MGITSNLSGPNGVIARMEQRHKNVPGRLRALFAAWSQSLGLNLHRVAREAILPTCVDETERAMAESYISGFEAIISVNVARYFILGGIGSLDLSGLTDDEIVKMAQNIEINLDDVEEWVRKGFREKSESILDGKIIDERDNTEEETIRKMQVMILHPKMADRPLAAKGDNRQRYTQFVQGFKLKHGGGNGQPSEWGRLILEAWLKFGVRELRRLIPQYPLMTL